MALADPTRRRIFELVADGPTSVGELAEHLPVSRPAVSQHLKVLRLASLVQESRVGARHIYSLDPAGLETVRLYFDAFWTGSLTAFKTAIEQSDHSTTSNAEEA
jgi:DNA-binding transcriptional ArsR family regulator